MENILACKECEENLASQAKENPKTLWKYINSKSKRKEGVPDLCLDPEDPKSEKTSDSEQKAEMLAEYFTSVFTDEPEGEVPELTKRNQREWKKIVVKREDISKLLRELNVNKSPGLDGLHPKLFKELHLELSIPLQIIFQMSIEDMEIPREWKNPRSAQYLKREINP